MENGPSPLRSGRSTHRLPSSSSTKCSRPLFARANASVRRSRKRAAVSPRTAHLGRSSVCSLSATAKRPKPGDGSGDVAVASFRPARGAGHGQPKMSWADHPHPNVETSSDAGRTANHAPTRTHETAKRSNDASTTVAFPPKRDGYPARHRSDGTTAYGGPWRCRGQVGRLNNATRAL